MKIGKGFFLAHADRSSGISTRQAVEAVHKALSEPGKWVDCTDHYQNKRSEYGEACFLAKNICNCLGVSWETRIFLDADSIKRVVQFRVTPLPQHRIFKCQKPSTPVQPKS